MISCQPETPENDVEVVFPEYKEYTVAAGESVTISFDVDHDWEIVVPDETIQWFWIQDGSFKLNKVKGKAGSQAVVIGVSATEELDNDRSCVVSMMINDKSQHIAKLTRPAKNKTFALYAAEVVDGEIQFTEDGSSYLYTDGEPEVMELVWTGSDYRLPVKIEANFNWTYDGPEWLSIDVPENGVGLNELNMMGVPSMYPLEDEEAVLAFKYGESVIKEYTVMIPGCENIFHSKMDMSVTELEFNFQGQYKVATGFIEGPATGMVMGTSEIRVFAVEKTENGYSTKAPSWLTINIGAYDSTEGASVLQERTFTVSAALNEGENRYAAIFMLPPYVAIAAEELFEGLEVKAEYAQYMVPVTQLSSDQEFISMVANPSDMALAGADFKVSEDEELYTKFGNSRYAYELVYTNRYAMDQARMMFTSPVTECKVFDSEMKEIKFEVAKVYSEAAILAETLAAGTIIDVLGDEYEDGNLLHPAGLFKVSDSATLESVDYSDYFLLSVSFNEDMMGGVIDMKAEKYSEGYVVMYGESNNILAVVHCVIDPEVIIEEVDDVAFIGESVMYAPMVGATLDDVSEDSSFRNYREGTAPVYHLRYVMENMPMTISIPSSVRKHTVNPYAFRHNISVNETKYDETFVNGVLGGVALIDGGVTIYMEMPEDRNYLRGNIIFTNSSDETVLVLVCTLDLRETAE